jgi:hypothetical protein
MTLSQARQIKKRVPQGKARSVRSTPQYTVGVAHGTRQKVTSLQSGAFAIQRDRNPAAFLAAGLSCDTTFDLRQTLDLPISAEGCPVPPGAPHGQVPRLGILHPSLVEAVQAAFRAVTS